LRRVNNDRRFTLQDLMCDMPDHEVLKLRYLAVQQSLWEKNVDGNAEVLLDLKHLQKLTLVVERSESEDSKEVTFDAPNDDDITFFEDSDGTESDIIDDLPPGSFWLDETEDYLKYVLDGVSLGHVCDPKRPLVEFKVLVLAK
jgi:hypothetical protein